MTAGKYPKEKSKSDKFIRVFGLTILICGAAGGIVLMSLWLLDVWQGESEFSWFKFGQISFLAFFLCVVGYFILRLNSED